MARLSRVAPLALVGVLQAATPGWTHHPFEVGAPQDFSLAQGLVSGLEHPVVMTALTTRRWALPLLATGLGGSGLAVLVGAAPGPGPGLALELVVSLSLVGAGLVHGGWLPAWVLCS